MFVFVLQTNAAKSQYLNTAGTAKLSAQHPYQRGIDVLFVFDSLLAGFGQVFLSGVYSLF